MDDSPRRAAQVGLVAGPLLALLLFLLLPDAYETAAGPVAFGVAGRATLGLMAWMATWWLTEAVDVAATALLPLAVLPLATVSGGSASAAMAAAARPYAHPFIGLFLGGFLLALAMERWGLHRRIALVALRASGTRPAGIVLGFMVVTATLSMWVSNTATTVLMLPIATSVLALLRPDGRSLARDPLAIALLLGIAYAASIGGIGTIIGTPPNVFLVGFLRERYGVTIGFGAWMRVGVPFVLVFLPIAWLLLTRVLYPVGDEPVAGSAALFRDKLRGLGPMSRGEWIVFLVFMTTAGAWILRPLIAGIEVGGVAPLAGLDDTGIAMIAALALFAAPVDWRRGVFALDWATARGVPWGILILFGGGLSLADAVQRHGVAELIGAQAEALGVLPPWLIVVAVVAVVIFLTELTSNTATTATLLPILAGIAPVIAVHPDLLLIPAAVAASCAFMMPVATPPNAIVFGTGRVTIPQMCRAGLWLNLIGIVLVTLLGLAVVGRLTGIPAS